METERTKKCEDTYSKWTLSVKDLSGNTVCRAGAHLAETGRRRRWRLVSNWIGRVDWGVCTRGHSGVPHGEMPLQPWTSHGDRPGEAPAVRLGVRHEIVP